MCHIINFLHFLLLLLIMHNIQENIFLTVFNLTNQYMFEEGNLELQAGQFRYYLYDRLTKDLQPERSNDKIVPSCTAPVDANMELFMLMSLETC